MRAGVLVIATLMTVGCGGEKGDPGAAGPQGPAGPVGPAGPTGADGAQGTMGQAGAMGSMGTAGQSVVASSEPVGVNCANGGTKLVAGSTTTFVCNGTNGTNGTNGADGAVAMVVDANDVVLGKAVYTDYCSFQFKDNAGVVWWFGGGTGCNLGATASYESNTQVYYASTDCSGQAYSHGSISNLGYVLQGQAYKTSGPVVTNFAYGSFRGNGGPCNTSSGTVKNTLMALTATTTPPTPALPVRLQ